MENLMERMDVADCHPTSVNRDLWRYEPEDGKCRCRWGHCLCGLSVFADLAAFAAPALANYPSQWAITMTQQEKLPAHVYTVELRFSDDQLEPSKISDRLNLHPSKALGPVQNQLRRRKLRPYWAYNGQGEIGFQSEWTCLEDGFQFLLNCLSSRKSEVIALARQFDGLWWCGHFQSSFDGGPTLSAKLLAELGSYEIPISIDNYFSDESDEG